MIENLIVMALVLALIGVFALIIKLATPARRPKCKHDEHGHRG